ncbi:MAG: hypothetical protein RDA78_09320 [Roseibium sp.]|uniref:hypothetical protein n=1 Tax=Roseibium sp. TaxID=1936156 RepID=UPI003D9BFF52
MSESASGSKKPQAPTPPITRTTLENLDPLGITIGSFFVVAPIPLIRMREKKIEGKKKSIPTPDTDEAIEMANRLTRFNNFLDDHWIDLCVPDADFRLAFENQNTADTEYLERDQETRVADLDHGRRLHRVFNNGTFEDGGRFYGGWWQQVRSGYRKFLTINWHSTSEIDYSGMHPTMLYAWEGLEMPEDPYLLDGLPEECEKLAKVTFLKMINATDRMQDDVTDLLPDDWDFQRLQETLEQKHQPIAHYLKSGIGVKLQKTDSEIAEAVMLRLMDEDDELVLPVHDSFIIRSGHEDRLKEVMLDAYASRMGTSIGLKTASNWLHEIIGPMDIDLHNHGVIDMSDTYANLVNHPDYARFNNRRKEFLEKKGEEWGQRPGVFVG